MKRILLFGLALFFSTSLNASSDIWKLYDDGSYKEALTKIYLAKSIPQKEWIGDLYFLEGLIAFRAGFWGRTIAIHREFEQKFLNRNPDQRTYFYFVRLSILAFESYRKFMFGDVFSDIIMPSPSTEGLKSDSSVTIRWPVVTDGSGRTEIWSDELDAFILNDLKNIKNKLSSEPGPLLTRLKSIVDGALSVYEKSDLAQDFYFWRLKLNALDLEWDLEKPTLKKKQHAILKAYEEIFKQEEAFELKSTLLLRLGKLNFLLGRLSDAEAQLTSFVKIQGPSIWREVANRYLGDIYLLQGNGAKAMAHMKAAQKNKKNIMKAYGIYRIGFALTELNQSKEAMGHLKQLLKTDWPMSADIKIWQQHLLQKMIPYLAEHVAHPALLKDLTGVFYIDTTFLMSDYEKNRKAYKQSQWILKNLNTETLSSEQKIILHRKILDLSLLQKNSNQVAKQCRELSQLSMQPTELEKLLYEVVLNLDKAYLQKREKEDFSALQEISELYFNVYGQKGEFSSKMMKVSSRYLNLWGIK